MEVKLNYGRVWKKVSAVKIQAGRSSSSRVTCNLRALRVLDRLMVTQIPFLFIQGYLISDVRDRMKYLRSSGGSNRGPALKKDSSVDGEPPPEKKRKQFVQSPAASEPLIPEGEDEHSNARNLKMLQSEEKKINPNRQTIRVLMERTFAFRRLDILRQPCSIQEVLKKYPSLRRIEQVIVCVYHFKRLGGGGGGGDCEQMLV